MANCHLREGRPLDPDDPKLFDLAEELAFDPYELRRFGTQLLKNSRSRKTIDMFLNGLDLYEYTTVPSKVHALLKYWAESGDRYGGELMQILHNAEKASVARNYQAYLTGTNVIGTPEAGSLWPSQTPPADSSPHRQHKPVQEQGRYSPVTTPKAEGITPKAIHRVARDMPDLASCVSLAAELGFSKVQMLGINNFQKTTTARDILDQWVATEGRKATGKVLHEALVEIGLRLIAEEHEKLLLG